MSSNIKFLIAGVAAAALLGGGIFWMNSTAPENEPADETEPAAEETVTEYIYGGVADDLVSVEVTNSVGGYTFRRVSKASGETPASYTIDGTENFTLDDSLVSNYAENASNLEQIILVDENAADLSVFGLDNPAAQAVLTFDGDDAKKITLLLGNDTPSGDIYVKLKDSPAVYTASSSFIKTYEVEKEYFVSKTVLERPDEYPVIEKVEIERPDLEKPIVLEYSGENESGGTAATHVMTSPVKAYLDVSKSTDYTHGLYGLTADTVLSLSPSEEELKVAGIETPLCTVTMTVEGGKKYVLKTGIPYSGSDSEDSGYIGYFEGISALWKFSSYSVPWVTMKPEDITSSLVFGSYIYDLSSLEIKAAGKTDSFEFTGSDEESYKVKLNGKDFDTERYRSFYQAVIKAPAEEICTSDEGAGELKASFVLKYNNGNPDETIEFYETDGNMMLIKKDGVPCFRCHASFVNKSLLPNIAAVDGNDDFVTVW